LKKKYEDRNKNNDSSPDKKKVEKYVASDEREGVSLMEKGLRTLVGWFPTKKFILKQRESRSQ